MPEQPEQEPRDLEPLPDPPASEPNTAPAGASPFRMPDGLRLEQGDYGAPPQVSARLSPFGMPGGGEELEEEEEEE